MAKIHTVDLHFPWIVLSTKSLVFSRLSKTISLPMIYTSLLWIKISDKNTEQFTSTLGNKWG
jgi:hypothetical protein